MSNSISVVGRLGDQAQWKEMSEGNGVLEFNLASDSGFGDKKITNWFKCEKWGGKALNLLPHLKKGTQLFIVGELTCKKFNNNEGVEKTVNEIKVMSLEFTGSKKD